MNGVKSSFTLAHFPDKKRGRKIQFQFYLFLDDRIGLSITIGKKEYRMVTFHDMQDLQNRGAGFGLTSEDMLFTSRILQ